MVKHIVMWKLKESAFGNDKLTNAKLAKEKLENLNGKIPGMIKLEIGYDFSKTDTSYDLVLYSEFESRDALNNYMLHPLHKEVMPFIFEVREERRMVDYDV